MPGLCLRTVLLGCAGLDEARRAPYAADINWSRVESLKPYGGIRIEDDVACTEGPAENLTRNAFQKLG